MSEASERLKARTENFAVGVVKFCETLPNSIAGRKIAGQLIDACTSVAANYRAACRAYTRPLFVAKLAIVSEEADESELWLRIIRRTGLQEVRRLGRWNKKPTNWRRFSQLPSGRHAVSASHPPHLVIGPSTLFNPTTICKSNNLRVFQFGEAEQLRRAPCRLKLASVQS